MSSCWLCQGNQVPHLGDQSQSPGGWCRASAGQGLESRLRDKEEALFEQSPSLV
jgi:hypothetical protein